jgi:Fibronectin type III domain
VIPNQVPHAPQNVTATVVSGTKVSVSFCPPLITANDITEYRVQWQPVDDSFSAAVLAGDLCATTLDLGSCVVFGPAIAGDCPYSLVVNNLNANTKYYFRVSAIGAVKPQQVDPTPGAADNTVWSPTVDAVPTDQPPTSPGAVVSYVLSGSIVQVHC